MYSFFGTFLAMAHGIEMPPMCPKEYDMSFGRCLSFGGPADTGAAAAALTVSNSESVSTSPFRGNRGHSKPAIELPPTSRALQKSDANGGPTLAAAGDPAVRGGRRGPTRASSLQQIREGRAAACSSSLKSRGGNQKRELCSFRWGKQLRCLPV